MGRDYEGQEEGIRVVKGLHSAGKELMMHHFNNSLCGALGFLDQGNIEQARICLKHLLEDMRIFGLRGFSDVDDLGI